MMVSPSSAIVVSGLRFRMCCSNHSRKILTLLCSCLCWLAWAWAEDLFSSVVSFVSVRCVENTFTLWTGLVMAVV